MKKLFVEELESRNLLNAGGLGHQAMPWLTPDRTDTPGLMQPDSSFGNFGGRDRFDRDFGSSPSSLNSDPTVTIIVIFPEITSSYISAAVPDVVPEATPEATVGPAIYPLAPPSLQVASRSQNEIANNFVPVSDANFQVETTSFQKTTSNLTDLALVSASENGSAANVSAVANALSAKAGSPILARTDTLAGSGSLRGPSSGLMADNVRAARDTDASFDGAVSRTEPLQLVPPLSANQLPATPLAKAIDATLMALPQFSGLVNEVAAADLARIEQGISNFLQHLDGTQGLALPAATRDLYPWIIAGLATAAACEMARRQMRKTPKAVNLLALQLAPWEIPHERENG